MLKCCAKPVGKYKQGDYVKVEFHDDLSHQSEWMWVKVERSDDLDRIVFGMLDNEPVVMTDLHLGMELAVSYDNVREHMKGSAFDQ